MEGMVEKRKALFVIDSDIPAGTIWEPDVKKAKIIDKAELTDDEVGELVMAEIYNPENQPLKWLYFKVDEKDVKEVYISGYMSSNMLPPHQLVRRQIYAFGKPASRDLISSTTLKFRKYCLPRVVAGPGGIVANKASVVLHYYVYKIAMLPAIFGTLDGVLRIECETTQRAVTITKPDLVAPVTIDNWAALPGGITQTAPKVWPLCQYATNTKVITTERDYEFDIDRDEVETEEQTLFWDIDDHTVIILEGLGVRPHANTDYTALKIGGDYIPRWKFYTKPAHNELHFGHGYPILPVDSPDYFSIPKLPRTVVIFATRKAGLPHESGGVVMKATAANIPVGAVTVAVTGKKLTEVL